MPIQKYTIDPPFSHVPGDTYVRVGQHVQQHRGNTIIATRFVGQGSRLAEQTHIGASQVTEFFEERTMPGINVSLVNVRELSTGAIEFQYSNGDGIEYADWAAVGSENEHLDNSPEFAQRSLALRSYRASPDGTNKTTQVGASVSMNFLASSPMVYTEPE